MSPKRDLNGMKFERLTVLREHSKTKNGKYKWLCKCECGAEKVIASSDLVNNKTKSCGCLRNEKRFLTSTKHGHTKGGKIPKLYNVWSTMKSRCLNKNNEKYHNYGGRGIKVCDEWLEFDPFYRWSKENGYKEGLSIDRIDVNGNYSPDNCRWADIETQSYNKRETVKVMVNGKEQTLKELSLTTGINMKTLSTRYVKGDRGERLVRSVRKLRKRK